jgi:hypothetical protein
MLDETSPWQYVYPSLTMAKFLFTLAASRLDHKILLVSAGRAHYYGHRGFALTQAR